MEDWDADTQGRRSRASKLAATSNTMIVVDVDSVSVARITLRLRRGCRLEAATAYSYQFLQVQVRVNRCDPWGCCDSGIED